MCKGRIVWLSNESGHYHPPPINLLQVMLSLVRQGYTAHFMITVMYEDRSVKNFPTPREFCMHHKFDDDVIASVDVVVAHEAMQREVNATPLYASYTAYNSATSGPLLGTYGSYTSSSLGTYGTYTSSPAPGPGTYGFYTSSSGAQPPGYGVYTSSGGPSQPPGYGVYTSSGGPSQPPGYGVYTASGGPAPPPPAPPPIDMGSYAFYSVCPVIIPSTSLPLGPGYGFYSYSGATVPPAPPPTTGSSSTPAPGYGVYTFSG